MAENEANVISIDGNEYDPSDLTDQQKYWIAQVQDLQSEAPSDPVPTRPNLGRSRIVYERSDQESV